MAEFPACPLSLKLIQHYLKIAQEHDSRDIVVSYWARLYALQIGLKSSTQQPDETKLLLALMDWLEATKKQNVDNERTEYVKYAKVFPLTVLFGIKIPSKWYRRCVGMLEILCGLAMALIPYHKIKNTANVTLLILMLLGVYQHYMVSDPFERSGPALVFTFMLGGRLVVWYQTSRKDSELSTANQAQTNGIKQD